MSPQEKAKELVEKFENGLTIKDCAMISVDEILNEYPSQCPKDSYEMERHIYWQQVKQEIEKL